jgi:deoxyuridine 5'-triphosphate nucleotidohydrolase
MTETPIYKFALRPDLSENKEFLPKQSEPDATGYDVRSSITVTLTDGDFIKIPLGFRVFCPDGWWIELHPRSSTFMKRELISLVGIIDQSFPGEVCLVGKFFSKEKESVTINAGDLIGQMIPVKLQRMKTEEISNEEMDKLISERNSDRKGGFGSTGVR